VEEDRGQCSARYPPGVGPTPDPVATLDDDDEVVFMASDAGAQAPLATLGRPGRPTAQALALVDPLDPSPAKFVYLFLRPAARRSPPRTATSTTRATRTPTSGSTAISIARDDPEMLGVSNTGYGPNLSAPSAGPRSTPATRPIPDGTPRASTDRFVRDGVTVATSTYEWRATGALDGARRARREAGQPGSSARI
jgi:hypothetical protein